MRGIANIHVRDMGCSNKLGIRSQRMHDKSRVRTGIANPCLCVGMHAQGEVQGYDVGTMGHREELDTFNKAIQ